jgi:hypothetical protein
MGQTVRSRNDEPLTAAFDNKPATLTNCDDSALRSIVIHGRHPSAPENLPWGTMTTKTPAQGPRFLLYVCGDRLRGEGEKRLAVPVCS